MIGAKFLSFLFLGFFLTGVGFSLLWFSPNMPPLLFSALTSLFVLSGSYFLFQGSAYHSCLCCKKTIEIHLLLCPQCIQSVAQEIQKKESISQKKAA